MWRVALKRARAMIITTGAGMGVDSGLPDFRGVEGFWRAYPPFRQRGLTLPQVSTPEWFDTDPAFAWGFFGHRYHLYRQTSPHRGFGELLEMAQAKPEGYFVVTSNVDGQFQKAGYDEERLFEVHGSIHYWQCRRGSCKTYWEAKDHVAVDDVTFRARSPLPHCPVCQAIARPNILMFGDYGFLSERCDQQVVYVSGDLDVEDVEYEV